MYNIGRPFLYYILSLSLLCLVVELIFKEIMHFHNMKYGHAPAKKALPLGIMKFTTMVDPSLVIITIHLVCMDHAPE